MKIVAFTLVAAAWLLMGAGCKPDTSALESLREKRDKMEPELVIAKRAAAKLRLELEQVTKQQKEASDEADTARASVMALIKEGDAIDKAFEDYRKEYLATISQRAIGMNLGTLVVGSKTYSSAKVKALDAWEVSVEHSGGIARVALRELSADLQTLLGYDPNVGEKPAPPVVVGSVPPPTLEESEGEDPYISAPAPRAPRVAGYTPPSDATQSKSSGSGSTACKDGPSVEVLTRWKGYTGGIGGGSMGSKVKGAKASVPSGYKPIGSTYSGSAMDRNKQK